ncbi:hypothetical protein F66182_9213 [Fusarium sp. NRRL 66182]|nr:hypothetical protein F66182_9213 [Fusarium sp. NRRL 66182]
MGGVPVPEPGTIDEIAVYQLHAGDGDGADVVFAFNNVQISVSMFPSSGLSTKNSRHLGTESRPLQEHLIDMLSQAVLCQTDDEYDELEDQVLSVILKAGKHLFHQPIFSQGAGIL